MKKLIVFFLTIIFILTAGLLTFAEEPLDTLTNLMHKLSAVEDSHVESMQVTIPTKEDANDLGNITSTIEKHFETIQLTLSPSEEVKIGLFMIAANEKLTEAGKMAKQNKQEELLRLLDEYMENIKRANTQIDYLVSEGKDVQNMVDKMELIENNADQIIIDAIGVITKDKAKELINSNSDNIYQTLGLKNHIVAKHHFTNAKEQYETAQEAYLRARDTDDEAKIQEALGRLQNTEKYKVKMAQLMDETAKSLNTDREEK